MKIFFLILAISISVFSPSFVFASSFSSDVQNHINAERRHAGLYPLQLDDYLVQAAEIRATEIQTEFAHQRPDGREVKTVLENRSYSWFGENLAISETMDAKRIVRAWLQSLSHRANILGRHYMTMGVACQQNIDDGHYYWVLILAG